MPRIVSVYDLVASALAGLRPPSCDCVFCREAQRYDLRSRASFVSRALRETMHRNFTLSLLGDHSRQGLHCDDCWQLDYFRIAFQERLQKGAYQYKNWRSSKEKDCI